MTWTQRPDDVAISLDLFPATVSLSSGETLTKTRVILSSSPLPQIFVFQDSPQGPHAPIQAAYDPSRVYGSPTTGYDFLVALDPAAPHTASILSVRPESNCGCGSQLRALRPFTTMRMTTPPALQGPLPIPFTLTP